MKQASSPTLTWDGVLVSEETILLDNIGSRNLELDGYIELRLE